MDEIAKIAQVQYQVVSYCASLSQYDWRITILQFNFHIFFQNIPHVIYIFTWVRGVGYMKYFHWVPHMATLIRTSTQLQREYLHKQFPLLWTEKRILVSRRISLIQAKTTTADLGSSENSQYISFCQKHLFTTVLISISFQKALYPREVADWTWLRCCFWFDWCWSVWCGGLLCDKGIPQANKNT